MQRDQITILCVVGERRLRGEESERSAAGAAAAITSNIFPGQPNFSFIHVTWILPFQNSGGEMVGALARFRFLGWIWPQLDLACSVTESKR